MRVFVLASGSGGNAIFFEFGKTRILVDAGISARRIEKSLEGIGVRMGEISGILITHEHTDHVKGLEVLARRHPIPVYARPETWNMIGCRHGLPPGTCRDLPGSLDIGEVGIEPFSVSHDAADPVGFCFYYKRTKCVLATDLGKVTKKVADALAYADVAILESNHDPGMLDRGPYPGFLKRRIRSDLGHLSNHDAARALAGAPRKGAMSVFLAHLSRQNNHPALAEKTVAGFLAGRGCEVGREIILYPTYQDSISGLSR